MAKRRRNQSSTAAIEQPTAQPPSKKPKIDGGLPSDSPSSQPKETGKSPLKSSKLEHPPKEVLQEPASVQTANDSGLSKAARKRKRQAERARKLKKQASLGGKSAPQASQSDSKAEQASLVQPRSTESQPLQAPNIHGSSKKPKTLTMARETPSAVKVSGGKHKEAKRPASGTDSKPKRPRSDAESKKKPSEHPKQFAPKSSEKPRDDAGNDVSKKTRRRQRAFQAKQGDPLQDSSSKRAQDEHDQSTASALAASTKQASQTDPSLLLMATQTRLMPRPTKEWIDNDDTMHDAVPAHDDTAHSINETTHSEPKPSPTHAAQSSLARKRPSSSPKSSDSGSPEDADRSFAKVGLPPMHQAPATRPGINTIASFSLSSRRHNPTEIPPSGRKISGLSGMRMDTGSIGSHSKPMNSLKANSVPSYSGSSDVQAAFKRFQKFTHGGESSDSEDDSDDSESESEDEFATASKAHNQASKNDVAAPEAKAVEGIPQADSTTTTTPVGAGNARATQIDTLAQADKVTENDTSSSDDSSASDEEDVEAADQSHVKVPDQADPEVAAGASQDPTSGHATFEHAQADIETLPTQSRSNGPPMQGAKDSPLFSDFNARHSSNPADPALERSNSFLGSDLGGNPSGPGPIDDQVPASQLAFDDHLASQDLFRTIDDFSREVFGSTRELPDSKPLPKILENPSEPVVTDYLSSNGLSQKSIEEKTPDKAIALNYIARGSSPVVYIVNSTELTGDAILDTSDDSLSDDEEQDAGSQPVSPPRQTRLYRCYSSSPSPLSTLTPSPPPEEVPELEQVSLGHGNDDLNNEPPDPTAEVRRLNDTPDNKKRKMTGTTSKHFSPQKSMPTRSPAKSETVDEAALERHQLELELELELEQPTPPHDLDEQPEPPKPKTTTKKKKGTGKTSQFFTPTTSPSKPSPSKTPRPLKGTSTCPVPSTKSAHFGLIQEKLWREPFWLLIAVTFLNKTAGRSAAPIFWELKELYPTPEALSQANVNHLVSMIGSLGLQNQRARRLILIAKAWLENPPTEDKRYRTLHYPSKNDGKAYKKDAIIFAKNEDDEGEENDDFVNGALEIGHIPGCGPYAWDSWRIFCRDVQRGLANDYNGKDADYEEFVPEWRRVLPLDKELRACLRWMWLRDGWVWDCETGDRRLATKEEMETKDEQERKCAKVAAEEEGGVVKGESDVEEKKDGAEPVPKKKGKGSRRVSIARRELDVESGKGTVDETMDVHEVVPAKKRKGSSRMLQKLDIESGGEGVPAKKGKNSRRTSIARGELDVEFGDEVVLSTQRRSRRNRSAQ